IPALSATTLTWSIEYEGCTDDVEVTITNNEFYVSAGNDDVTSTNSYQLNGDDPLTGTGIWTVVGGSGSFVDASLYNTVVNDLNVGANDFRWTVSINGCSSQDDVTITYVPDNIDVVDGNNILVYPNPTNGIFNIETDESYDVVVTDVTGKVVKYLVVDGGQSKIDITQQASGIYFVNFSNDKINKTITVIKK
ncbi:MAG: T9SS type A sorting domain-containing protein, partial [Bacteroidales bacterium]|nr:T9SS type A sorting domain-containing protein [Bacteroidales bacterium]